MHDYSRKCRQQKDSGTGTFTVLAGRLHCLPDLFYRSLSAFTVCLIQWMKMFSSRDKFLLLWALHYRKFLGREETGWCSRAASGWLHILVVSEPRPEWLLQLQNDPVSKHLRSVHQQSSGKKLVFQKQKERKVGVQCGDGDWDEGVGRESVFLFCFSLKHNNKL